MSIAPITWEKQTYHYEQYDGFFTNHEGVLIQKIDEENAFIHWGKWEYYSIAVYDNVEDYENGEENYNKETPCYVGLEEDIPDYMECDNFLPLLLENYHDGMILEIHPRRYAGVKMNLSTGEVDWETWDNGESYVDSTYVIRDGKCIPFTA